MSLVPQVRPGLISDEDEDIINRKLAAMHRKVSYDLFLDPEGED